MKILMVTFGSAGDVHPFIGLGLAMHRRAHQVTLITEEKHRDLVSRYPFVFSPLPDPKKLKRPRSSLMARIGNALLRPVFGPLRKIARLSTVVPLIEPVYEAILRNCTAGETLVVASATALGARVARETLDLPLATIHLSPVALRSVERSPIAPPLHFPRWLPRGMKRLAYRLLDRFVLDPELAPSINNLLLQSGADGVRRIFHDWRHSPDRTIGLFPEWFAPVQADWPSSLRLTDFPRFDDGDQQSLAKEIEAFLSSGDAPIVFTPGTAMKRAKNFFAVSLRACQMMKRRGIFVTRFRDQLPKALPPSVLHVEYAPFAQLLPRTAAVVHHAGIGTISQALAAGIPQILLPQRHDQPDNAQRLVELGVGAVIRPWKYSAKRVATKLESLLTSPHLPARCRQLAQQISAGHGIEDTCDMLEAMLVHHQTIRKAA